MANVTPTKPVPRVLLPEILGFSPQLLLDDIINVANNAVTDCVDGMESLLNDWAEKRGATDAESTVEVQQGLVSFQTLLEYHTDIAFDFFEAWSLRNIFAFPPDLPIVVPHQKGFDLETTPEQEQEIVDEIAELRKQIDNQRRLKRLNKRAFLKSSSQLKQSQFLYEHLSFLSSQALNALASLPEPYITMFKAVSALPPVDPSAAQMPLTDPGKRPWETGPTGYLNWASGNLVARTLDGAAVGVPAEVANRAADVGAAQDIWDAMDSAGAILERDTQTKSTGA